MPLLDKLAVAERQLDTAIWLWFNDGDIVSIVTLSGAVLGVMDALFQKHKKGRRPFPFDEKDAPPGMTAKQARKIFKAAENFSKHANTDHDKSFDYEFDKVSAYLYCAVAAYFNFTLKHEPSSLHGLFWTRYGIMNPALFKTSAVRLSPEQRAEVERLKSLSRREYFNQRGPHFVAAPSPDFWPDDRHTGAPPE